MGSHDPEVDEARYLEVIRRKTAKLFEAAARLGGGACERSAGGSKSRLADYGRHVGTAFQLIDDVLDYSGERRPSARASATTSPRASPRCR